MILNWKIIALILFISALNSAFKISLSPEYPSIKICRSRLVDCANALKSEIILPYYRRLYSSCTHIIGNLVLCNLRRLANGSDPDLNFLSSIQEVSGYVYIANNNVKRIPLTSLRIIRGNMPYQVNNLGNASLFIYRNADDLATGLEILDMRNLTVIKNHNVVMGDNPLLCHFAYTVDHRAFFVDKKRQSTLLMRNSDLIDASGCNFSTTVCHESCQHCWGPGADQCQIIPWCTDEPGKYCRLEPRFKNISCDQSCLGGCVESTSNCWACRDKRSGKSCVNVCPPKYHVDQTTRQELNPDFKYDLHDICVRQCPEPLLKMESVCVIECDFKTTMPMNGSCVPCHTKPCEGHCQQKDIFGKQFALMRPETAQKFEKCMFYTGAIYVEKRSFKLGLEFSDLWNLHNLREVVGYIYLDLTGSPDNLRNLTFMENLYKVTTEYEEGVGSDMAIQVYSSENLEFLGMRGLRYVDTRVHLDNLPSLCYLSGIEKITKITKNKVKDPASCVRDGHVCHSECLQEAGCWGPGPAMCTRCCTYEADGVCVANCEDAPGYYLPPSSAYDIDTSGAAFRCPTLPLSPEKIAGMRMEDVKAAMRPALKCARCHEECAETCSGPGQHQCIGECKHYRWNDTCVRTCELDQYADFEERVCRRCSSKCLPPLKTILPRDVAACSGAGEFIGVGGCSFCYFVQKDNSTSKYNCLGMRCPPGHFGNATKLKNLDLKQEDYSVESFQVANADLKECVPCHSECEICAGPGNHISVCQKCRHWKYRTECVSTCPPEDTYMPNVTDVEKLSEEEKKKLADRECLRCHEQCSGGCTAFGPEFCRNCRYAKIMLDMSLNTFVCNSTCPPDMYKMENTNLCLNEEQYEKFMGAKAARARNQALIATGIVLLFLLIFAVVLTVLCFNYKAKRSRIKEAIKSTYTNIKAPDMKDAKSSREPNMGRWEMINIDDLSYDRENDLIGRGAFGEVYRGKWRVPKRILSQYNMARTTTLDVAIKVIRSPSPANQGGPVSNLGISSSNSGSSCYSNAQNDASAIDRISARSNLQDMLAEARVMASVQHKNCLPLIGVCLTRKMQCMVSVFVEEGSLDRYLRLHKDDLNSFTLLSWAEQIADGMAYLEERGIIHRDLAARNVLVQSRELVQITDFGLAKMLDSNDEDSVVVRTGRVPIRWLAIETLQSGIYSHKTDVWSYGVTLWEIFTFGKQPYENISTAEIKDHVMKGVRLTQPEICTLDTYMVMVRCWMEEHESRPTFLELMQCFHKYCQTPGRYLYIEGDEYAITRTTPYTPSPAPWTEMKLLPSALRGMPDGNTGPPNGSDHAFRFPEEPFFDDHQSQRSTNPEAESLLPHHTGCQRRFPQPVHQTETGLRNAASLGRQNRPVTTNTSLASTNLDAGWQNGSGAIAPAPQTTPKYYNTSAFLPSGTYGPLVRPPSPPLAEAEKDDDIDVSITADGRGGEAEVNYLSTLGTALEGGEATTQPEDYLEPRGGDDLGRGSDGLIAVGNPNYFATSREYLPPSENGAKRI